MKITLNDLQATQEVAKKLGQMIIPPFVLFLKGSLGTGKTNFTQSLAKGLNIKTHVNSPTFVLMKIYEGELRLVHVDAYRLEGVSEPIGVQDECDNESVLVVEWPEYLNEEIKPDMVLTFEILDEHSRSCLIETNHPIGLEWSDYVATRH